jgi:hypothetical protein
MKSLFTDDRRTVNMNPDGTMTIVQGGIVLKRI